MNTDIRLSVGFWQHPKTKKTARRLGLEGIRSLQVLWLWAAVNRPEGSLSGMDWEDIELAADWQGEERTFFDHCLGVWLDETPDGYALHDWQDHNTWVAQVDDREDKARFSRLAQVNREAYDRLKKDGINAISKEDYEALCSRARRRSGDATATPSNSSGDATANAGASLAPSETPAPAPAPAPAPSPALTQEEINTPPLTPPPGDAEAGLAGVGGEASPFGREEEPCPAPRGKHDHAEDHDESAEQLKSWPDIAFVQLLDAYPAAKRDEASSWAAWRGLRKAKELPGINTLLHAVCEWEDSRQWQKDNGEYIPLLSNWLQKRRFLDHPPRAAPENHFPSEDELNAAAEKMRTLGVAS